MASKSEEVGKFIKVLEDFQYVTELAELGEAQRRILIVASKKYQNHQEFMDWLKTPLGIYHYTPEEVLIEGEIGLALHYALGHGTPAWKGYGRDRMKYMDLSLRFSGYPPNWDGGIMIPPSIDDAKVYLELDAD